MPKTTTIHSLCVLIYFISICDNYSSYVPSDNIALNCGSSSSGTSSSNDGRNWTGDIGSEFMSSSPDNKSMTSQAFSMYPAVPEVPYLTARIFRSQFTYTFNVNPGPKFVRLHFYPSSYMGLNTSEAFLTVTASAGRYTLLRNFSASLAADYSNLAFLVREFIVHVNDGEVLDITFAPSSSEAYAFVNGIEVVSMPPNLYIHGGDVPGLRLVGHDSVLFYIDETYAFETCYRLNVGGADIEPKHDTGMFRSWTVDNGYIFGADSSETPYDFNITLRYPPAIPPYTAPEMVYLTARSMTLDYRINLNYNLSWYFPVDSGFWYLVRLHFCEVDRERSKINQRVFNIFINNQTAQDSASVIAWGGGYAVPVYQDYVVMVPEIGKGEKQDLWLELHPSTRTEAQYPDAILNGAEIFKLSSNDGNLAGLNPPKIESAVGLSPLPPSKSSKKIAFIITGCLLGGLLVFLIVCFLVYRLKMMICLVKPVVTSEKICASLSPLLCHRFSMEEMKAATSNFDEALVIGIGGFGKVYKGCINGSGASNKLMIAVKRGSQMAGQGFQEFQTEIAMLSQLRHNNLVSLNGYCTEDNEMIIVYDYMANGTLYDHLHNRTQKNPPLTWEQRLKICTGAARGLYYLHTGTKHKIIHRDVKTSNILLDENWVAKISDFGLSKLGTTSSCCNVMSISTEVKGSCGYLDPEYYRQHKLTEKSDVYSFGVVLLEVLSGRPAMNPTMEDEYVSLADWALCCYQNGSIDQILDTHLQGIIPTRESSVKFMDIAKDCLAERGVERPSMGEVLWNLESLALQLQINSADADGSPTAICIGTHSNSDKTPGVEFSEIMMAVGR